MATKSRFYWVLAGLAAALLGAGTGVWLHFRVGEATPVPTSVTAAAPLPPTPPRDPPLPARAESDARVRGAFAALSHSPAWRRWLTRDDLLDRLVQTVDNVSEGHLPRAPLDFLASRRPFRVVQRHGRLYVDPRAYHRFDAVADVVGSLDASACAHAYETLLPLLRVAYHAFGYPDRDFDDVVHHALLRVEQARLPQEEPALVSAPGALYRYADPALESADDVTKALLRLGPKNMLRLQEKARELDGLLTPPRG